MNHHAERKKNVFFGGGVRGPAESVTPSSGEGRRCLQLGTTADSQVLRHQLGLNTLDEGSKLSKGLLSSELHRDLFGRFGRKSVAGVVGTSFPTKQTNQREDRGGRSAVRCSRAHRREAGPESVAPCLGTRTMTTRSRFSPPREDCTK